MEKHFSFLASACFLSTACKLWTLEPQTGEDRENVLRKISCTTSPLPCPCSQSQIFSMRGCKERQDIELCGQLVWPPTDIKFYTRYVLTVHRLKTVVLGENLQLLANNSNTIIKPSKQIYKCKKLCSSHGKYLDWFQIPLPLQKLLLHDSAAMTHTS